MNTNINTKYTEECMESDSTNNAINEDGNELDLFADDFNIIDGEYDADLKEIRIIV